MWLLISVAGAATLTVDPTGAGDYPTIAEALDAGSAGDTVLVEPGVYIDRLIIRYDVTIRSTGGRNVTTIRDGWENSLILVDGGNLVLEGFEVTSTDIRHCIRTRNGTAELHDLYVHDCDAFDGLGGGLRTDVGTGAIVRDSLFEDNRAHFTIGARAPHIYARGDLLDVEGCTFLGGDSDGDAGGVMAIGGDNRIVGNHFEGNVATDDGGALFFDGAPQVFPDLTVGKGITSLVVTDNTVVGNQAGDRGGGMFMTNVLTYEFARNTFCGNTSPDRGGGAYVNEATAAGTFHHNVFLQNDSGEDGGAIFLQNGAGQFEHNDFLGNTALRGGAIAFNDTAVWLRHNLVAYNDADGVWVGPFPASALDADYNAWFDNPDEDVDGSGSVGANAVLADPLLVGLTLDGDCTNDDLTRAAGSPLIDAGDPTTPAGDGTPPDIGAFGTEPPTDTGTPATPTDTGAEPVPPTDTGTEPLPSDTGEPGDGEPEPDGESSGGCGCASGPGGSTLGWALLGGLGRRGGTAPNRR